MLWKLITAPEGVEKGLRTFGLRTLPIRGNGDLLPHERLDIYANMYFYRIRDSLKNDFPALVKLLGETGFHNLVTSYLAKNPPTHFSLRYAGQNLPRFLRSLKQTRKDPFSADLAEFEWDLLSSFDAADSPALTIEELKRIPLEQWEKVVFKTNPSFIFKKFQWPVDQIRPRLLAGKKPGTIEKKPVYLSIWRQNYKVHHRPVMDKFEQKSLLMIRKGKNFGELCEATAKLTGSDDAPLAMARLLSKWVGNHWLVG